MCAEFALADYAQTAVTGTSLSKCKDELGEAPQRIAIGPLYSLMSWMMTQKESLLNL